jgi:hypothetical protein
MKTTVQARLDEESQAALKRLTRQLGWSPSQVVREGLRLLAQQHGVGQKRKRKIVGLGQFEGGPADLATNRKYLDDLGQ